MAVLSVLALPLVGGAFVLLLLISFFIVRQSLIFSNNGLRHDAISRSPINSLFVSSVSGLLSIRAYHREKFFL